MTEALAVALVTGGITASVSIAANLTAYFATSRQLRAERYRIEDERHETGRKNREASYHGFLVSVQRYDAMMTGYIDVDEASFGTWIAEYFDELNRLYLFGHPQVIDEIQPVVAILHELGRVNEAFSGDSVLVRHRRAYIGRRPEFAVAVNRATRAMREDVAGELGMPTDLAQLPARVSAEEPLL